jgi:hypothetical protein
MRSRPGKNIVMRGPHLPNSAIPLAVDQIRAEIDLKRYRLLKCIP